MLSLCLQVIFFCGKHSECREEMYCNDEYICHACDDSFPNMCDSYDNDCCSISFLKQCKKNPYGCQKEIMEQKSIFGPVFISSFLFTTLGLDSFVSKVSNFHSMLCLYLIGTSFV